MTMTDTIEAATRHFDGWVARRLDVQLQPLGYYVVGVDARGEVRIVARPRRKGKAVKRGWRTRWHAQRALAALITEVAA